MELIDSLNLTESTEINFFISDYNGVKYANIRKFVKSERYTGPTQQGITLTKEQLIEVVSALESFSGKENVEDEVDLLEININEEKFIKVSIKFYKGHYYLDIRLFYKTDKYSGPSKKGISIPIELFSNFTVCSKKMLDLFNGEEVKAQTIEVNEIDDSEIKIINASNSIKGIPNKYAKYF